MKLSLSIAILIISIFTTSCGADKKEQAIRSKITATKWVGVYEESRIVLTFDGKNVTVQAPKDRPSFELASLLHTHGTSLAGKQSPFVYEYSIDADANTITVDDNFELKYSGNQIEWPLWNIGGHIIFKPTLR